MKNQLNNSEILNKKKIENKLEAYNKMLSALPHVSESLQLNTFKLHKVTRNDYNNSDNIVFVTNENGEGTDIDIEKVFNETM